MRGHLFKRGKSQVWYAKIRVNGKQKLIKLGSRTKHEAERALRREIERRECSLAGGDRKATFKELADLWLSDLKLDKKLTTLATYGFQLSTHLVPYFGPMVVSRILPEDVERFKQQLLEKVSPTTVNYNLRLLHSILDMGIRMGYAFDNAAKLVKRAKQKRKPLPAFSKGDVQKFLDAADEIEASIPGQNRTIILTAVLTGMRMGEILAMKWENLNWGKGTYSVKESYSPFGVDTPKTESSLRSLDLSAILLEALKLHKVKQNEHRLKTGLGYQDNGLIFTTETGTYINPSNLRNRIFYPAVKKAGLPHIRFHDLRGLCATLLLEAGAPLKYVQDLLGHKTPSMTLGVYARVTQEAGKEAQERLQAYVFG